MIESKTLKHSETVLPPDVFQQLMNTNKMHRKAFQCDNEHEIMMKTKQILRIGLLTS